MPSVCEAFGEVAAHGALLALDAHDLVVSVASANAPELLGIDLERVLGAPLATVLRSPTERELRSLLATSEPQNGNPIEATSHGGAAFDMIAHLAGGVLVLELEPAGQRVSFGRVQRAIDRLQRVQRSTALARGVAEEIRALTGFERGALYRNRAGVVELVAAWPSDAEAPGHVTLAAGEQVRFVADLQAPAVALRTASELAPRALDLAGSVLRPVAEPRRPGAQLVIALGAWGVIVCEHPTPRHVPYTARAAAQLLAQLVTWHVQVRDQLGDELRASNMAKDEFLATVSHELRTPLNAMLGWLRLIEAGQVAAERQGHAIATVTRNASTLAQLVEELLDISRIVSGKMRLELQPVAPAPIIEAALATVQPTAEAKGVQIVANLETSVGPVLADAGRLQQIAWNLVSNAVKFTPEGGRIDVRLRRGASTVVLEVADTGSGIDPQLLPYVFERFRQGESAATRMQGLGLGLAIVRHLAELHGGEVTAASPGPGKGATFTVRLPLAIGRAAPAQAAATGAAPPAFEPAPQLRGLRVLAVDDERDANDLLRAVLATSGVDVTTATTGAAALSLLSTLRPHVLISDIGMPGLDGYELIQAVRALPEDAGGRIPAVAITAFARIHDRSRAFLAGFDVYLAKPIDPAELIAVLVNLAGRRTGVMQRVVEREPGPERDPAPPRASTADLAGSKILIVEDDHDSGEMLSELLGMSGARVELARCAADAMEAIHRFHPDVVVSDISLPDKSGFAFMRELRALGADEGGWIPAIAVSGHADPEHARESILAGFQLHITKPIDPDDLIARLTRLVGRTARRTQG